MTMSDMRGRPSRPDDRESSARMPIKQLIFNRKQTEYNIIYMCRNIINLILT
jgi:hypothetical protein